MNALTMGCNPCVGGVQLPHTITISTDTLVLMTLIVAAITLLLVPGPHPVARIIGLVLVVLIMLLMIGKTVVITL
jgi:hypothetical protein